jgi:DNA polymerase III alpha subunit
MNRLECKKYEGFETNCFWDLIAMNALSSRTIGIYSFFRSTKNGEEEIKYDLDVRYLGETYGITFTKSDALSSLRIYKGG